MLPRIALLARHHYRAVFVSCGLLVAVSVLLASRLRFDTDFAKLLPRDEPAIGAFFEALEEFGTSDHLLIAVRVPAGRAVEPYTAYVEELVAELRGVEEIDGLVYSLGEPEELLRAFFPKAVLFLDEAGRQALVQHLSDRGIRRRIQELRRRLMTPQGVVVKTVARLDPLGLSEILMGRVESTRGSLSVDWTSGYYLSQDHRLLLVLATPVRRPQDVEFDRHLVTAVEKAVARANSAWSKIHGVDQVEGAILPTEVPPVPEVVLGGAYMTALDDASFIQRDMTVNIATSVAGVMLLFLFAFRRVGPLAYALLPLGAGLALTFGFSALSIGSLSAATSGVAALLIGLGIDFVIVSYGRYVEERQRGLELEPALQLMARSSGRAVVIGAVTTAATFYAFTFTDLIGLRQMGFLTGTGILFCMVAVLFLLPALLAWSEDHHRRRQRRPTLFLHSFGLEGFMGLCMRWPRSTLSVGLALTLVAGAWAFRIDFEESFRTLRPEGNRGIETNEEVARHFGSGFHYMMLLVSADSLEEVLRLADEASAGAQRLVQQEVLKGYNAVTSLIPPRRQQNEVLHWLEEQRDQELDLDRIRSTFSAALEEEGMRLQAFEPALDLLAEAISPRGPITIDDFQVSEETRRLLQRSLRRSDGGWKSVVYLYPPANRWRREAPPEVERLARSLGPQVVLTGTNVINETTRRLVRRDAWVAGILGTLIVALLLWLDYRRLRETVLALVPLGVGIVWMLGAMSLIGLDMNFFNIFVTTMIIGIGVDYGIHMLHRYREAVDTGLALEGCLRETGKAIAAAALSTMVGFGSMSLSHYPGLRTTGLVAILGALCTALVAISLLPAYLSLTRRGPSSDE